MLQKIHTKHLAVYLNAKSTDFSQGFLILALNLPLDAHQILNDVPLQDRARREDPRVGGAGDPAAENAQGGYYKIVILAHLNCLFLSTEVLG